MGDASDWYDQQAQAAQYSVWDPAKKQNVELYSQPSVAPRTGESTQNQGVQSPTGYIRENPQTYQNYTGAVSQGRRGPIHVNAYAPEMGRQPQPTRYGFDPVGFKAAQERVGLNPYSTDPSTDFNLQNANAFTKSWTENVRRIPGGNPTYGVLPGSSLYYNLQTAQEQDPNKLDPLTRMFGGMTQRMPGRIPTLAQTTGPKGIGISGRGYDLKGLNPAQQRAQQAALGGNTRAAAWLASTLGRNWTVKQPNDLSKFASQYYGPGLMAAITALAGGVGGPLVGAGFGALSAGAQSRWQDPAAIAIGGAGGALGGWGGGQAGQALGAGAIGTGALAAAGGSLGAGVPMQAYRGNWDPGQLARNAAIAGSVGGLTAGLGQLGKPGYVNTPGEPGGGFRTSPTIPPAILKATMPQIRNAAGTTLDYYLPGRNEPPNPYAERQRQDEEARRRRLALSQPRRR